MDQHRPQPVRGAYPDITEQQREAATGQVLDRVTSGFLSRLEAHRVLHALGLCACEKEVG